MDLTIAGTGHRPPKLTIGSENAYNPIVYERLVDLALAALQKYQPSRVISGMALGWDQALAEASVELSIPFYAYIPFQGFESLWPNESKKKYLELLEKAAGRKTICKPGYAAWKLQRRNEAMVDALEGDDFLLALWDGGLKGGTFNCLKYASLRERRFVNLWGSWRKHGDALYVQDVEEKEAA